MWCSSRDPGFRNEHLRVRSAPARIATTSASPHPELWRGILGKRTPNPSSSLTSLRRNPDVGLHWTLYYAASLDIARNVLSPHLMVAQTVGFPLQSVDADWRTPENSRRPVVGGSVPVAVIILQFLPKYVFTCWSDRT